MFRKQNAPREARHSRASKKDEVWRARLPAAWRALADPPLELRRYRDEELAAERMVGYDADGNACYTAHRFCIVEPRSDDDETFYAVVTYGEELAAWRLIDERWLIWRRIRTEESPEDARGFYSLSEEIPR
ncbi:MAG: hypothetical protein LBO79_03135 [Zoogloeaceae bacterium]|nr:hypothetical protein [Zoogloeaceae bacterium]